MTRYRLPDGTEADAVEYTGDPYGWREFPASDVGSRSAPGRIGDPAPATAARAAGRHGRPHQRGASGLPACLCADGHHNPQGRGRRPLVPDGPWRMPEHNLVVKVKDPAPKGVQVLWGAYAHEFPPAKARLWAAALLSAADDAERAK